MDFTALSSASFRLYVAVNFVSICGIWINRVMIGWLAWSLTQSGTWVGVISFLLFAPTLLAGPFFGVLADRMDVRKGALVTQLLLGVMIALMLVSHIAGLLDIWLLALFAFLFGLTASANHPIRLTLVPLLVAREAITNAVTLISINFNAARLIGPAIAGLFIEVLGPSWTMLISVVVTLPMMAAIVLLRPRPRDGGQQHSSRILSELMDGVRHAAASVHIQQAIVVATITAVVARGALEILPVLADGLFGRGAQGLGQMLSAAGAGALLSGIAITALAGRTGHLQQLQRSRFWMLVGILAVLGMGWAGNWLVALALVFAMGASGTFTAIYTQSAIQLETDDAHRGRVISLWLFAGMGGNALGAIVFGLLADWLGAATTMMTMGGIGLAGYVASSTWARLPDSG